jgi:hypothetical protein
VVLGETSVPRHAVGLACIHYDASSTLSSSLCTPAAVTLEQPDGLNLVARLAARQVVDAYVSRVDNRQAALLTLGASSARDSSAPPVPTSKAGTCSRLISSSFLT